MRKDLEAVLKLCLQQEETFATATVLSCCRWKKETVYSLDDNIAETTKQIVSDTKAKKKYASFKTYGSIEKHYVIALSADTKVSKIGEHLIICWTIVVKKSS